MGQKDTLAKKYMSNPQRFADFFNGVLYGGEQIIRPEHLKERDTTGIAAPYAEETKSVPVQRFRDILKQCVMMQSEQCFYLLIGLENQSDIHYAMPVRNMLYNAITYSEQVSSIARKNREMRKLKPEEFLSGLTAEDKLMPVVTFTLYWGDKSWDGPVKLKQMLSEHDDAIDAYIDDCSINLFSIIDEESFDQFKTTMGKVFKLLHYRNDGKTLWSVVESDETYRHMDRENAEIIGEFSKAKIQYGETGEDYDMCKAIMEIKEEGRLETLLELVQDDILSEKKAADMANMTVEEFLEKTKELRA